MSAERLNAGSAAGGLSERGGGGAARAAASFRDAAGFVFYRDGTVYRQVNKDGAADYDRLMGSGLYAALVKRRWLIPHEEANDVGADRLTMYRVLRPTPIPFISYPYEWSFSQLRDAALLTLDTQLLALEHGMSLKDASAYNVQFLGGRPILIDTLSFEAYEAGQPWIAYRQYCQHFLAPLALMAHVDIRLSRLLRTWIDGVPLDLASRLLPTRTRWRWGLGVHIHLHAKAQRAYSGTDKPDRARREVKVSLRGLSGVLHGLRKVTANLLWKADGTEWSDYYQATNYSDSAFECKRELVAQFLAVVKPACIWDLGANTGVLSRLGADAGARTIAFDVDPVAVDRNYRRVREANEPLMLPLLMDLTNPSPGLGWAGSERDPLSARGPADCIMALALIHHLAISNNVPLAEVARYFASLGRYLIIEFVPKSDSQVKRLLSARKDIFGNYDQTGFEIEFSREFEIMRREPVKSSDRTLYLMRRAEKHAG